MNKILTNCAGVKSRAWDLMEEFAAAGYKVELWADGCADVHSPNGNYSIEHFRCDCPDAQRREGGSYELPDGRHVCKHVLVTMIARPCEHCGGTMLLNNRYFDCPRCGNARDARIVKAERREVQVRLGRTAAA